VLDDFRIAYGPPIRVTRFLELHAAGQTGSPAPAFDELRAIPGIALRPTNFGPSLWRRSNLQKLASIAGAPPAGITEVPDDTSSAAADWDPFVAADHSVCVSAKIPATSALSASPPVQFPT